MENISSKYETEIRQKSMNETMRKRSVHGCTATAAAVAAVAERARDRMVFS